MSALKRKRRDELELTVGDEEAREKEKVAAKIVKKKAKKAEGKKQVSQKKVGELVNRREVLGKLQAEGWVVIKKETLEPLGDGISKPNIRLFPRSTKGPSITEIFEKLFPDSLLRPIARASDEQRQRLLTQKEGKIFHYWKREISSLELKIMFGLEWLWEIEFPRCAYKDFYRKAQERAGCDSSFFLKREGWDTI